MFIYNLVILLYGLVIKTASLRNAKAKLWVKGRRNWQKELSKQISAIGSAKKVWVHCASLGEFEQGRPLIEAIKKQHPGYAIVLTFFSPSGYEGSKGYTGADVISYLPLDTRSNADQFLQIVKPEMAIFIKYEFWINFLRSIQQHQINAYLVSAVFKPHHPFFKWYGGIFIRSLKAFKTLFVQDENSGNLLRSIGFNNVEICGDTRFDRVLEIKTNFKAIKEIEAFKGNGKLIVAGSTWPGDENLVLTVFQKLKNKDLKLVMAPHEIDEDSILQTCAKLQKHQLTYSLFTTGVDINCNVLILNTMGMLSRSYYYADIAYIGGGFNDGIHNILEPSVFGIPTTFYGSGFEKFNEAVDLVKAGLAVNVGNEAELESTWQNFLNDKNLADQIRRDLELYFARNGNVTEKLMKAIEFS